MGVLKYQSKILIVLQVVQVLIVLQVVQDLIVVQEVQAAVVQVRLRRIVHRLILIVRLALTRHRRNIARIQ